MRWSLLVGLILLVGVAGLLWWALPTQRPDVVVYCSVDRDHSEALVDLFEQESGLDVDFVPDTEADKSVGLARRLSSEAASPRCDVFWANEPMNTIWLADAGLLDPLPQEVLGRFPKEWHDPAGGRWVGFALRARILMVNTKLLPDRATWPTKVSDLLDPRYADLGLTAALAAPLTGTTYTHAVALLTRDEVAGKGFLEAVVAAAEQGRVKITPSNGSAMQVARDPANKVAFCLTDTDDAWAAKQAGFPIEIVYPDQEDGGLGTMVIPNTLALVKGHRHPDAALRLLQYLSSPTLEAKLAAGPSAQIPVRPDVPLPADGHVKRPGADFRVLPVDWPAVGKNRDRWLDMLTRLFRKPL
jgi:iron(III) transport system substrate-binding protein